MLADYSVLWQAAADALWTNSSLCVEGSTGQESSGDGTNVGGGPNSTDSTPPDDDSGASSLRSGGLVIIAASMVFAALV